ncbi:uncharacterized protein LOC133667477 isoform X1 [Apis cerana]|uniref:uncharacterized protein LOC133667477 isoform X1 n=1 Tax=Apis cerana TaxID=7461 RepID=UPI002B226043|nr:uncharacterized protein LOC133667477 isoform X1 [Apis cerana]
MSEEDLFNWTDLPKEIEDDFISIRGDYDYPLYLSEKEEWINYKNIENKENKIKVYGPFLICELNRFVPYLEGKNIKFHPLNMPYIRIGKINIMGFVVCNSEDAKCYRYQVDDGTGTITIFYDKKFFAKSVALRRKIDKKYYNLSNNVKENIKILKNQKCPKKFPNPRPKFFYPPNTSIHDIAIFEYNWSLETNNGTLGEEIQRCNYIHALGYCTLDFLHKNKPKTEITFTDISHAKINFIATKIMCLTEQQYNKKLLSWIYNNVRKRYDEHLNESFSKS